MDNEAKHTPGQVAAKACMDYLMEENSLSCWRAEDVVALVKIIDKKTAAPELLEALQMVCDSGVQLADAIEKKMLAAIAKANT